MPDDLSNSRTSLRSRFPVIRFIETSGVALSPASVVIATISSLLIGLAGWFTDRILSPIQPAAAFSAAAEPIWAEMTPILGLDSKLVTELTIPWTSVVEPTVFALTSQSGTLSRLRGLVRSTIAFFLWSLVGVILCRRAVFLFVGNDQYTLQSAVDYGFANWIASLTAPIIPLAASMLIGSLVVVLGFLGRFPYLGAVWLLATSPIATILGFATASLLLATALGWPLMLAAISIDNCDGFGGLSRAYSGLTSRPWQVAGYILFSLVVGVILMLMVSVFAQTTIWCVATLAALGCGDQRAHDSLLVPVTRIVSELETGIAISFFWSAASVIYLFLRYDVDGVPIDRVASMENIQPAHERLPVVGMPATDSKNQNGEAHSEES